MRGEGRRESEPSNLMQYADIRRATPTHMPTRIRSEPLTLAAAFSTVLLLLRCCSPTVVSSSAAAVGAAFLLLSAPPSDGTCTEHRRVRRRIICHSGSNERDPARPGRLCGRGRATTIHPAADSCSRSRRTVIKANSPLTCARATTGPLRSLEAAMSGRMPLGCRDSSPPAAGLLWPAGRCRWSMMPRQRASTAVEGAPLDV